MGYLRVLVIVVGFAFFASCAATTAVPIEGHRTHCESVSSHCQDVGDSEEACEKIAPAGFYWEALPAEKANDIFRCMYELRRLVPKTGDIAVEKPGCKSDTECKGDRICEKEHCQEPDGKTSEPE